MPYIMDWIIPNQVLYIYNYGHVTVAGTEEMMNMSFEMALRDGVDSEGKLLHILTNSIDVTKTDVGIKDIRRIFGSKKDQATHPGWSVSITESPMDRFFGSIAMQFLGIRGRMVASVEDGIRFLSNSDDMLPSYDELMAMYLATHEQILSQIPK